MVLKNQSKNESAHASRDAACPMVWCIFVLVKEVRQATEEVLEIEWLGEYGRGT